MKDSLTNCITTNVKDEVKVLTNKNEIELYDKQMDND